MDKSGVITNVADCSATDTVIIIIKNKRQRNQIIESLIQLGDRVVDYHSQSQMYSVADIWGIPHRLMIFSYRDYYENRKSITKHLSTNKTMDFPLILVFGRWWRKLPNHPAMIDGDDITPDALCRMYWVARGQYNKGWRLV